MTLHLAVLPGDGIGPSVIRQAIKVLDAIKSHLPELEIREAPIGGSALATSGHGLPEETLRTCRWADAVLLGAVGDPHWDVAARIDERPAASLLRLRQSLGLSTNLRPIVVSPDLFELSHLREETLGRGIDMLIVREMSAGILYGQPRGRRTKDGEEEAYDTMAFTESQVRRLANFAFNLARARRGLVTSVDQANVLESSRLWRSVVTQVGAQNRDVQVEHKYIDNCANEFCRYPYRFDVVMTEGLFGGVLSDEAAAFAGSIGMLASATVGAAHGGVFEPVHGSAPKYTGQDRVNPIGAIRSLALLLSLAFKRPADAELIYEAVRRVLAAGVRTYDIWRQGCRLVGTEEMGDAIAKQAGSLFRAAYTT